MKRLKQLIHGISLNAMLIFLAIIGTAFPLIYSLISGWRNTADFITETYGKSLYAIAQTISFPEEADNERLGSEVLERMTTANADLSFTYYLFDAEAAVIDSGCTDGTMLPFDSGVYATLDIKNYTSYISAHRGRILAVRVEMDGGYSLLLLYEFSNFRSVSSLMGTSSFWLCVFGVIGLTLSLLAIHRLYLFPLRALLITMRSPDMDERTTPYISWKNEVGQLCLAYQNRYNDYKNSLEEINQLNAARRKSEVDVLQNQINAHFIYNTLNNIQWLASADRMEDVIRTAKSLDTLLRGCANNDSDYVRLEEEIAYVEAYLSSQKIRFHDIFDYEFDIDPFLLMEQIPKFIIQPIVENSIYHGFLDAHRKSGHICVTVRRRGHRIVITVYDNGIGIPHDQIHRILNNTRKSSGQYMGVAIGNINKRIRLLCGREYGLGIESVPDKFTRVEIVVPATE